MTPQEAIQGLLHLKEETRTETRYIYDDEIDMAISALEHVAEEQRAIKEFENVNPFGEWECDTE